MAPQLTRSPADILRDARLRTKTIVPPARLMKKHRTPSLTKTAFAREIVATKCKAFAGFLPQYTVCENRLHKGFTFVHPRVCLGDSDEFFMLGAWRTQVSLSCPRHCRHSTSEQSATQPIVMGLATIHSTCRPP